MLPENSLEKLTVKEYRKYMQNKSILSNTAIYALQDAVQNAHTAASVQRKCRKFFGNKTAEFLSAKNNKIILKKSPQNGGFFQDNININV